MHQHCHEAAMSRVCKSIVLLFLLNDQVVQVLGQFLQNGQNHDALYNNYFNNNYSYNNIGHGYIGNGNNYIDRLGQNNQYGGPPRNVRRDPFNQNHQFNPGNGRGGYGAREGQGGGGGPVMAWDLRDKNTDSWGRLEWDLWFNELEVQLGFREVSGGIDFSNQPSGEGSRRGPMDFDLNWPEWQNVASIEDKAQIDRSFFQKATYPNEYEQQKHEIDKTSDSSVVDEKNLYDDVMGDLMERPVIKSYFLRRKSHGVGDVEAADVWYGDHNIDKSNVVSMETQSKKEGSEGNLLGGKNKEQSIGDQPQVEKGNTENDKRVI